MQISVIVSLAVLIRIVFCFFVFPLYLSTVGTVGSEFLFDNYYEIALSLLNGQGFTLSDGSVVFHRPPLYSMILALALVFAPDQSWHISLMQLTNCLLGGGSVLFTMLAVKTWSPNNPKASIFTGLLVAFWPFSIWITKVTITENLLLALVPLVILLGLKYMKTEKFRDGLGCGAVLGFLCLTHSSYVAFAAGFLLAVFLISSIRTGWSRVLLILVAAIVVVSPWTLRNHSHGFTSIQTATGFGLHYLKGLYYFDRFLAGDSYFANLEVASAEYANGFILENLSLTIDSDKDRSNLGKMQAVDNLARQHLFDNLGFNIAKIAIKSPLMWIRQQSASRATLNFFLLAPLILYASLAIRRERWTTTLLIVTPTLSLTAAFALVFIEDAPMRYALPLFPLLAMLAGAGFGGIRRRLR